MPLKEGKSRAVIRYNFGLLKEENALRPPSKRRSQKQIVAIVMRKAKIRRRKKRKGAKR